MPASIKSTPDTATPVSSEALPYQLYGYVTSPFVMKVHCYLLYKQLPFSVKYVNPLKAKQQLPYGEQVPVLQTAEGAQTDSTNIGYFLDERHPQPGLSSQQECVREADAWVTQQLIPVLFYSIYPRFNAREAYTINNALRLGTCVKKTTPDFPGAVQLLWPVLLNRAGFIRTMVAPLQEQGTVYELRQRVLQELESRLADTGGAWLAGTETPSLADLSAWPQLAVPYILGLKGMDDFRRYPQVNDWVERVAQVLPFVTEAGGPVPPLVPEYLQYRTL